ncbi:MAG: response regulator [Cellvibrio sp.]|uniref:response regulator n=1 Tax=Cellvibrio sp. TaxID=1965322 RepID=UPI0031B2492F
MTDRPNEQNDVDSTATLFHDIATPLVIAKMKAELLAKYLPDLIKAMVDSPELRHLLPEGEKFIDALIHSPEIMVSNLAIVQKKINLLSTSMRHQTNSFISTSVDDLAAPDARSGVQINASTRVSVIKTILLVDDEVIHRDIGESLLAPHYSVDFAKNGLEALSMCEQKHYDLILMDLHMPKMNGEQATVELRTRVSSETIIFGLTSLPIGANRSGLLARGFTDFLEKPLSLQSLQNLLRSHERHV